LETLGALVNRIEKELAKATVYSPIKSGQE